MYVCMCVCREVSIWSKFGPFRGYYLVQVGVIIWSKFVLAYLYSGFKPFFAHSVLILCAFFVPNFFVFKKGCNNWFFFKFLCFKFNFWKVSFLCLLKHYKIEVSNIFVFVVARDEKKQTNNDIWNFWICFFPKMAVSWRRSVFQTLVCWNPYFYSVLGCALFGPSCQKREFLDPLPKKTCLIDSWKALFFGIFGFVFFWFFFCFFFVFICFCFLFGGFKGQMRWPQGPHHLALNPPYLFCFILRGSRVRWGGPKGHLTWP